MSSLPPADKPLELYERILAAGGAGAVWVINSWTSPSFHDKFNVLGSLVSAWSAHACHLKYLDWSVLIKLNQCKFDVYGALSSQIGPGQLIKTCLHKHRLTWALILLILMLHQYRQDGPVVEIECAIRTHKDYDRSFALVLKHLVKVIVTFIGSQSATKGLCWSHVLQCRASVLVNPLDVVKVHIVPIQCNLFPDSAFSCRLLVSLQHLLGFCPWIPSVSKAFAIPQGLALRIQGFICPWLS